MKFMSRLFAAIVLLLLSRYALAEDIDKVIEDLLAEPRQLVSKWEQYADYALYIVIAVGVIGIVTTLIQLLPIPPVWTKVLTGLFGAVVGALTVIGNASLDFDRRQYENLARLGRHALNEIKASRAIQGKADSSEARSSLLVVVRENIRRILELEERLHAERRGAFGEKKADSGFFIGRALAGEEGLPGWATRVPSDDTNLYFVGLGEGGDYVSARQASRDRAFEDARQFLGAQLGGADKGVDASKLAAFLLESGRVLQTYYILDKEKRIYRFYSLLGLNRKLASSDLRLYAAKGDVKSIAVLDAALREAKRSDTDYISARLKVYEGQTAKAQSQLSRGQYEDYLKARELRFSNQRVEAIGKFRDLVKAKPDFYLGWFNLALVLDEEGRLEDARQAYQRALEIARKENIRDPSIYNSYGYLLYRMKRPQEAVPLLDEALKLAPDHPTARATLAAAKSGR